MVSTRHIGLVKVSECVSGGAFGIQDCPRRKQSPVSLGSSSLASPGLIAGEAVGSHQHTQRSDRGQDFCGGADSRGALNWRQKFEPTKWLFIWE